MTLKKLAIFALLCQMLSGQSSEAGFLFDYPEIKIQCKHVVNPQSSAYLQAIFSINAQTAKEFQNLSDVLLNLSRAGADPEVLADLLKNARIVETVDGVEKVSGILAGLKVAEAIVLSSSQVQADRVIELNEVLDKLMNANLVHMPFRHNFKNIIGDGSDLTSLETRFAMFIKPNGKIRFVKDYRLNEFAFALIVYLNKYDAYAVSLTQEYMLYMEELHELLKILLKARAKNPSILSWLSLQATQGKLVTFLQMIRDDYHTHLTRWMPYVPSKELLRSERISARLKRIKVTNPDLVRIDSEINSMMQSLGVDALGLQLIQKNQI